jgi:hypothetical protein
MIHEGPVAFHPAQPLHGCLWCYQAMYRRDFSAGDDLRRTCGESSSQLCSAKCYLCASELEPCLFVRLPPRMPMERKIVGRRPFLGEKNSRRTRARRLTIEKGLPVHRHSIGRHLREGQINTQTSAWRTPTRSSRTSCRRPTEPGRRGGLFGTNGEDVPCSFASVRPGAGPVRDGKGCNTATSRSLPRQDRNRATLILSPTNCAFY